MAKFSGKRPLRKTTTAPVRTTGSRTTTFEGGAAYTRDAESDLFLLAATNMVSEDTFYESADVRDKRYKDLIHAVAANNPNFIAGNGTEEHVGLAQYLRQSMFMRSASTVMAAEYLAAGGIGARSVIARALQRPDEPAELLAYWMANYGRNLPMPLKRGVADAVTRLYNERAAVRYDGGDRAMRLGDVIELVHPVPKDERQDQLFRYLLDVGHNRDEPVIGERLTVIRANKQVAAVPEADRRQFMADHPDVLYEAHFSWERLSSWLPGGMDAEAWEGAIPNMGVMALTRNLRNFDQKGISASAVRDVIKRITDPEEVEKARLFPYQTWSAYSHAPSDNWKQALGETLNLATQNIPDLDGTLVVIDTSSSMSMSVSRKSDMTSVQIAAVMAMATAKHCSDVDVVIFGDRNRKLDVRGCSMLSGVQRVVGAIGSVGHSTFGHTAIRDHFDPKRHRRVVLFTDDQQHDSGRVSLDHVPLIYTFNLGGYNRSSLAAGANGRYTLGGFTDATFTVMKVLESGKSASWPF